MTAALAAILGGGAPLTKPTQLPGCVLWLRGDLGVTSGATFTWADQSGTGDANKNMSSVGAARPTADPANAAYNNQATIDFAIHQNLVSGVWAVALVQPFTEFFVGSTTSGAAAIAVDNQADTCTILAGAGVQDPEFNAGTLLGSTGSFATPGALGVVANGVTSKMFFNSHLATGSGNAGANGRAQETIGGLGGAPTAVSWIGPIAERFIYNRILSAAEIQKVMAGYLGPRYGIHIA